MPAGAGVPLLNEATLSSIGTVYISSTGLIDGEWTYAELTDLLARGKKAKAVDYALDATPHITVTGVGVKGPLTLLIPSCPAALFTALEALAATTTHYDATFLDPQKGEITREVEVVAVTAPRDSEEDRQWATGDPLRNVVVTMVSFGTGS
jgi:hypothetical protein